MISTEQETDPIPVEIHCLSTRVTSTTCNLDPEARRIEDSGVGDRKTRLENIKIKFK